MLRLIPAIVLASCFAYPASADIYAYVDDNGVPTFTDVASDPRAKVVWRDPVKAAAKNATGAPGQRVTARVDALKSDVLAASKQHSLDPALLLAVMSVESGFNTRATSPKGAMGLMQLMPATAKRYGVRDAYSASENISGGASYLRDLLAMFNNDLSLALAAYNAGEGAVMRHGGRIPPYRETQEYVPKVLKQLARFKSHF